MSSDNDFVEAITESVVREYLSRKGMKSTLQVMDQECPRRVGAISNRQALMKELHLEKLMKTNKEQESPLRAMLELMTKFFVENEPVAQALKSKNHDPVSSEISLGNKNAVKSNQPTSNGDKYLTSLQRPNTAALTSRRGRSDQDVVIDDELDSENLLGEGKSGLLAREASEDGFNRMKMNRPLSSKSKPGAVLSNMDDASRRRLPKSKTTNATSKPGLYQQTYYPQQDADAAPDYPGSNNGFGQSTGSGSFWGELGLPQSNVPTSKPSAVTVNKPEAPAPKAKASFQELLNAGEEKASKLSRRLSAGKSESESPTDTSYKYNIHMSSMAREKPAPRVPVARTGAQVKPNAIKVGDLEFGDVDDLDDELNDVQLQPTSRGPAERKSLKQLDSKPIDTHTAIALKTLIFGSAMQYYNDEWRLQSYAFCDLPDLQYGIVQRKGGPCGVLAAVQAVVLQEMLFGDNKLPSGHGLKPSRNERTKYLALALAKIFWRAGEEKRAVVAISSNQTHVMGSTRFRQDDVTETLMLYTFLDFCDLCDFLKDSVKQFEMDGNPGVVLSMCSTVLSRGIDRVKKDMDEVGGKLMGAHGYCTQELVNLLLTGEAVSNVFNDVMELDSGTGDSMILKGISTRSDIGLLSLFEHYRSCQVGTYLKTPKYPIWVVCSESHFSVLFSTRLDLVSDWKAERRFDLYYWDGLSRQQEEIKLTIYTTNRSFHPSSDEDLVPPLEHCIRTKWHGAEIDWNGYEPIL
ncbi:probable ubiquitin carboxyl-terminal hydrolase MINDY-4 isoform X2 [Littorina saxatilis]|uniref:Ubiquitin carboxyl-terminal hydrolase MINDY n=1 Tax=Littorina saxatilis TaxID=31220 RepID=A0AAN9BQD8_9CAEN